MKVTWNADFNKYNLRGMALEVLEVALTSQSFSGVSIKVYMRKKNGSCGYAWIDLGWFDTSKFPKEKTERFIPLDSIDMT